MANKEISMGIIIVVMLMLIVVVVMLMGILSSRLSYSNLYKIRITIILIII